jgi:hypothetical protein
MSAPTAEVIMYGLDQQPQSLISLPLEFNVISIAREYSVKRILAIIKSLDSVLRVVPVNDYSVQNETTYQPVTVPWMTDFLDFAYPEDLKDLDKW